MLVRGAGVVVCDWVDGDAPSSFALHWPVVDASTNLEFRDTYLSGGGYCVTWTAIGGGELTPSLQPMVRSPGYGQRQEATLLRLVRTGRLPACIVSCFADNARTFRVSAHDHGGVRVQVDRDVSENADPAYSPLVLQLTPGSAPVIEHLRERVIWQGAIR
jgi:hypothetical protein